MRRSYFVSLVCVALLGACPAATEEDAADSESESGDGDGDGSLGDGDGDTRPGDGDGDSDTSAGDGDTDPGDGDGDADTDPGDGDGDGDTDTGEGDCLGPGTTPPLPPDATQPEAPREPGSTWAYFELEDFQPQSCNYAKSTSLEAFKGRVTLVTLVRATCEICQGTIEKLEQMQLELGLEGHEVNMVAINQMGYEAAQHEFVDRASFPLLQDTAQADAWELMNVTGMGTDDMYIYDSGGILHSYFSYAAANPSIDLHTPGGWDVVYGALLAALGA